MSEIDWSKAPEGATHFYKFGNMFLKVEGDGMVSYLRTDGTWEHNKCHVDSYGGYLIPRPSAWSGDGLPPVGTHIEWLSDQYGWLGGRVVGHDGMVTVVSHNDGYTGCHAHEVRPIRTPEQIAAEEREKAISKTAKEIHESRGGLSAFEHSVIVATWMYDNGYRKVEP